jgi:hypothetical protein
MTEDEINAILDRVNSVEIDPLDYRAVATPDGIAYTPGDLIDWIRTGVLI